MNKLIITLVLLTSFSALANEEHRERRQPPQVAIDACIDKVEGDAVLFTTRRGNELEATCKIRRDQLLAVPDNRRHPCKKARRVSESS